MYTNPVIDDNFPDPTILRAADGWYYAYGTQTKRAGRIINLQVARSRNLVDWEYLGEGLPAKPAWATATQKIWAPHVSEHGGRYYLYYSARADGVDYFSLAVAVARAPAGPFIDSGQPLLPGPGFTCIDPMAFDDPATGQRLLYWGSGFGPIWVRELADDRLSFRPGSVAQALIQPTVGQDPDDYHRLIEGAWVHYRAGWYYLFFRVITVADPALIMPCWWLVPATQPALSKLTPLPPPTLMPPCWPPTSTGTLPATTVW